jgi:hypothetical protein
MALNEGLPLEIHPRSHNICRVIPFVVTVLKTVCDGGNE